MNVLGAIEDLPIEVKLLWPSGVIQQGTTTKDSVSEHEHDGKRLVTLTFEVKPHDHLAWAGRRTSATRVTGGES